ncbi:hypothetical protein SAY86_014839 [Trapa natans]|uniref:Inosine/uridine-preferring nucleoside hydrolase domain-containing protein n=1 Tax=Trapa natans TaxID=22666 RepID=A0AAN7QGN1_TRANT|nr:hypothetical protein SAY86_014839 [Trapa natans]
MDYDPCFSPVDDDSRVLSVSASNTSWPPRAAGRRFQLRYQKIIPSPVQMERLMVDCTKIQGNRRYSPLKQPTAQQAPARLACLDSGNSGNLFTDYTSNPYAEFNIFGDPFAAYQVFHSGIPFTLVPLHATNTIPITEQFFHVFHGA